MSKGKDSTAAALLGVAAGVLVGYAIVRVWRARAVRAANSPASGEPVQAVDGLPGRMVNTPPSDPIDHAASDLVAETVSPVDTPRRASLAGRVAAGGLGLVLLLAALVARMVGGLLPAWPARAGQSRWMERVRVPVVLIPTGSREPEIRADLVAAVRCRPVRGPGGEGRWSLAMVGPT